ncbi:MAG TPA: hypothetical protein VNJ01_12380 [Bacteriovoracaceae bacterium]|nr:hypothetical protein [Bacteriovoracaceae bacterium]
MKNEDLSKKAIAMVKDIEVQSMMEKTSEFNDCKVKAKFEAKEDERERELKVKAAQDCFLKKLANNTDKDALKKLSESLGLESYGLVQSKNMKDIQNYLSNKMYKSLTGIDPEEKDRQKLIDSMSFNAKDRKLIDQKVFIDLYKAQVIKNSLYEVSRFCFENLRTTKAPNSAATDFATHWAHSGDIYDAFKIADLTDTNSTPFGTSGTGSSKEDIYKNIFTSIQGANQTVASFNNFFFFCAKQINELCEVFEANVAASPQAGMSRGANACLSRSKLKDYKKALAVSKDISKEFDQMSEASFSLVVSGKTPPKFFGRNSSETESIDYLTSYTSQDLLEGGASKDSRLEEKQKKCEKTPELSECEEYISIGDGLDKVKHNYQVKMALQKEVELARVRALVSGDQKNLEEYLEANGYFTILDNVKNKTPGYDIIKAIGDSFEAKKVATLQALQLKMGSRQMSQKDGRDSVKVNANIAKNATVSKDERTRLAQLVLFNNIITSYIILNRTDGKGKNTKNETGRNVNAWKKEQKTLESSNSIDKSVFAGLEKEFESDNTFSTKDSNIEEFQALDTILGKKEDPKNP